MASTEPGTDFFGERRVAAQVATPEEELTAEQTALVAEACGKSGVVWLRPLDAERAVAAWHVWHDGAVHVVSGVDEQLLPMLAGGVEVLVPSKESGARLLRYVARGEVLPARTPQWDAAADALAAKRLNAHDPATQRERWAAGTVITRLDAVSVVAEGPGAEDEPSGAAPPPPAAGTTRGDYAPWHLGGRRRRRR